MSDFRTVRGFEDVWRPPVRPGRRRPESVLSPSGAHDLGGMRARLQRLVRRAPEVMVKVSGRTRDPGHLRAHLDYIARRGDLELEDRDGLPLRGREEVWDLADDWSARALMDRRRRADTPFSLSLVLSMPEGTPPVAVREAARAFGAAVFSDRFDYAFALHTDAAHPHVHMAVCALGDGGERLSPKKADLEMWRQVFAEALRARGVEAEATPRRARGVTRKAERTPLRKIRERHLAGRGRPAEVLRGAYREAARAAFQGETAPALWEVRMLARQRQVRGLYLSQAGLLRRSADPRDRALGEEVERFVHNLALPDSQRLALARELRAANLRLGERPNPEPGGRAR